MTGHGDDGVRRIFLFLMVLRIYNIYTKDDYLYTYTMTCINFRRSIMWTKPAAMEMRFGFEVTMYVMNK